MCVSTLTLTPQLCQHEVWQRYACGKACEQLLPLDWDGLGSAVEGEEHLWVYSLMRERLVQGAEAADAA